MKRSFHRFGLIFLTLLTFVLTGCFEYSQKIVLNSDGSGELEIRYRVPVSRLLEVSDPKFPTQRYEIQHMIRKNYTSQGVRLNDLQIDKRSHSVRVYANFSFKHISILNTLPQFRNEEFGFSKDKNEIRFNQAIHLSEKDWLQSSTLFETGIKFAFKKDITRKVKIRFEVQTPYPIESTNASYEIGDRRAVWHFRLSEILKNGTTQMEIVMKKKGKLRKTVK
ncbi:hypothetical protein BMS3Abin05_02676 [bacterium BMS3Abin05]|nr:hypothetical protein BMS3Abin05_02676 [bacterium BMS3Abin05]GBE26564.1 hypothetical protein BMS3Bbin03_00479 [bacterium BMS3Bbin03]HDK35868.1 hypothetical protein [Bacteroidota bacterium]HDZ12258.1 hypothetical protein [Bacteroidota bacterium]